MGLAKASPTMVRAVTPSRSTVDHTSWGSRRSGSDWTTTVPPTCHMVSAAQWAAPCMKGGVGSTRGPPRRARSTTAAALAQPRGARAARKMSSWRHRTPLGMPVVPPV